MLGSLLQTRFRRYFPMRLAIILLLPTPTFIGGMIPGVNGIGPQLHPLSLNLTDRIFVIVFINLRAIIFFVAEFFGSDFILLNLLKRIFLDIYKKEKNKNLWIVIF